MALQVKDIIATYKILSKVPSITRARLNSAANKINSEWSIRDTDKSKSTKYRYDYILDSNLKTIAESDFGADMSNELLSTTSPSGKFRAVIREEKDNKDVKKQYLEIWQSYTKQSIDLKALDIHGDVYADSEFGCLNWSPDEESIVYVAERKLPKTESYIKRKPIKDNADGNKDEQPVKVGEEYIYKQDWGEQLVGKHLSVIVVCRLASQTFQVLEGLPNGWCPGQVRFAPDGGSVVGVAWVTEPRRLGLIYCSNRPSYIFNLTIDSSDAKQMRKISCDGLAVRSPRFSPSGNLLVWLQRPSGGPHHACHALAATSWPLKDEIKVTNIVDIVPNEIQTANGKSFYGIYCLALPANCFSRDGKRILFSTSQKTEVRSYVIDVDGSHLTDVSNANFKGSTVILDVASDIVVASCSNMVTPTQLFVARLGESGAEHSMGWHGVSAPLEVPQALAEATVQCLDLQHENCNDEIKSFSAIYFAPSCKENQRLPLVVWPHGGPHSNFINSYSLEAALLNLLGFACVQINYRGSTGNGQASVDFLPSRIGQADVVDCHRATEECIRKYAVDPKKICLFGGSHGGFLVAHLSGQYPDVYAAVVSRNPVTDVATMFNYSDIPDWCAVEAGFEFTEHGPLSEEQLLAMRRRSPLTHVHRVKAPTALMLGSADKRVPHYQGLDYYNRLRANGCPTKLYMYDDNHALSSLPNEADNLINSVAWFLQHTSQD